MPEAKKDSQIIRDNLEGAQKAASGTATSRKVASSAAAMPTGAAGASAGITGGEVAEYNRAAGAAGKAGGSARDFADQARGLGGLVRLYATFAANIFAVSAAFGALSKAMDTTNMVRGLDQLGAASGKNLGTLSKQLALASDGAVSLREAMEATAKASSAGLTSKQILAMGEGAKKAAQALGLDMTDALSRLSRGISKIEPELLDELGIYVKIDDAAEKYARTLGKTASSLTEYEKRQSFALAVLDQVNKKFGEIQIDTNPYNKLLASLQNLLQTGLEVVNRVLGPIVKFLSESPVALTAVLLLIGKTLLTQAIPYFGQFRKSIDDQAIAAKKALETAEASRAAYRAYKEELIGTAVAQQELADRTKATAAVQALSTANRASTRRLASTELITQASAEGDVANLEIIKQKSLEIDKQIKLITKSKATTDAAKQKNQEDLEVLRAAKRELDAKVKSAKEYKDVVESTVKPKQTGMFDTSKAAKDVRDIQAAQRNVKSIDVLKDIGKVYDAEGFKAGFGELKNQLISGRKELGLFGTAMTAVKGTGLLLSSGIGQLLSVINGFSMAIAAAVGVFELFDSWLSTNSKQAEEFTQALESTDSTVKLVSSTIERISKQGLGAEFLPQSIEARANAFVELSANVEKTTEAFRNLNKASSWWDNLIDSLKIGGGRTAQLADSLSKQITAAFAIMKLDSARESVQKEIKSILQVKSLDTESINKAFKDAGYNAEALGEKVSKILAKASQQAISDANKLKEALQGFDSLNKAYQDLAISLKDTSPIATFADNLIKGALQAQEALTNNTNIISLFNEIVKDNSKLKFFSPESIKSLKDSDGAIKSTIGSIESLKQDITDAEKAQNELNSTMGKMSKQQLAQIERYQKAGVETFVDKLQAAVGKGEKAKIELAVNVDKLKDQLQRVLNEPFLKGAQLVAAEFVRNSQKAQLDVTSSLASKISGPGRAEAEYQIQKERIEIEKSSISAMYTLTQSIERNSLTLKQMDLQKAIREEKVSSRVLYEGDRTELDKLEKSLLETEAALGAVDKGLKLTIGDFNKLSATFPGIAKTLSGFFAATMGTKSKLAGTEGQLTIAGINRSFGKEQEKFQEDQKRNKEELARLNIEKERASIASGIYGLESQSLLLVKQQTAELSAQKEDEIARADIRNKITEQEKIAAELLKIQQSRGRVLSESQQATLDGARESAAAAQKELKAYDEQAASRKELRNINNEIENQRAKAAGREKEAELQQVLLKSSEELARISVDSSKQELDALISAGQLSDLYAAKRLADYARENQAIVYQSQLREAAAVRDAAMRAALNKAAQAEISGGDQESITATRIEEENRAIKAYDASVKSIEARNVSATRAIEITRNQGIEQAKLNEELKKQAELLGVFTNIADTLSAAFGKTGQVLNNFVSALGDSVKTQMEYTTQREKLLKVERDYQAKAMSGEEITSDDIDRRTKAEKDLGKLTAKNARDEMVNNTKLVGSVKNMFKEKTAAYKLFNAFERAMHVYTLTMDVAKIASGWMVTNQKLAQDQIQTASKAAPAGASAAAETPGPVWTKLAAGLAAFAFVMSLAQGGKGGAAPAPGTSSADRQETQGTGMSWLDGKKVETGGGVFGDAEAKSDPIRKSLEKINDTSVDGVFENRKMVRLLESIDRSIGNAAKGLYSIPGLRTGSAFGTVEGTQSGGGLLGTGLFASKTTKAIQDSGLVIQGTFRELAGQISGGVVQLYQDVVTTTKKWWGKTSSSINREVQDLPEALSYINEVFSYSGDLFVELGEKLSIGKDEVWNSLDALGKLDFEGSLRNLKGDDLNKELQAIIGSQLDKGAVSIFGSIVTKFKEFGESALETVVRIVDETEKGLQALGNISIANGKLFRDQLKEQLALQKVTETVTQAAGSGPINIGGPLSQEDLTAMWERGELFFNYATLQVERRLTNLAETITGTIVRPITAAEVAIKEAEIIQNITKLFGNADEGFDNFLSSVEFFRENFLSEAERLAPIREMVIAELGELGLGFVNTRDEFKGVVQSLLDVKNPLGIMSKGGQELLATLLKLAPAFNEVYKAAEPALMSVEEFAKKVMTNELDILKTQASLLEANKDYEGAYTKLQETLLITRKAELTELEKLPKAQGDVLIAQAKYKWSLEDITNASKLAEQVNKRLADSYTQAITVLQGFVSYLDEALGLVNQAIRLRGQGTDLADATHIERTLKLQDLSNKYAGVENEQRRKNIIGLQKFIWALEDEKAAKDNYVKALQDQKTAIQNDIADLQKLISGYDKLMDQQATIQELTGAGTAAAKLIAREKELASLRTEYAGELVNSIVRNQEYIWALEDEQAIKDKLIEQRDKEKAAIESTISTIKDSLKAIKDYKKSLMFSSGLSILTPEEQYKEAKTIFEQTLTAARTVGVDEAGVQAQQKALSDLPEASNRLLELSRTLFASSDNYMTDYKVVQDALTATETALGEQLTDAEKQLDELTKSTKFLDSINQNTQTTADLLVQYTAAQSRTNEAARLADTRTVQDLQSLKDTVQNQIKTKLEAIEAIDKNLETLTGKQVTSQEATEIASKASAAYNLAVSNTSKALADISADVNGGTIAQAIVARQAALDAINNAKQQIDLLNDVKNNTYSAYTSQVAHFQNLINTPQEVNVGEPIAQALVTIARNTAATANRVDQVQTAIAAGTNATVKNNTAVNENAADAIVAAVLAQSSAWRGKTIPVIRSGSGVLTTG